MVKLDKANSKASEVDHISDYLGFRIQLKCEDVYTVQFSKLPIKKPGMTFQFDIHDNSNLVKGKRGLHSRSIHNKVSF